MKKRSPYRNLEYTKNLINQHFGPMIESGVFPSQRMLSEVSLSGILRIWPAKELCKELGCKFSNHWQCRDGHVALSFYELVLDEYLFSRNIAHEPGVRFSGNYKCDQRVGNYFVEIWGYLSNNQTKIGKEYNNKRQLKEHAYAGLNLVSIEGDDLRRMKSHEWEPFLDNIFESLRFDATKKRDFDVNVISKSAGYGWNDERIVAELAKVVSAIGKFPTYGELKEMGKHGLVEAILRLGGMHKYCEIIGFTHKEKQKGYWTEQTVVENLKLVTEKQGHFPSGSELKKIDLGLWKASMQHGGLSKFRSMFGYAPLQDREWSEQRIVKDLQNLCNIIGHFPSYKELKSINTKLLAAMQNRGTFNYFRSKV
jgi:hypothetical protein